MWLKLFSMCRRPFSHNKHLVEILSGATTLRSCWICSKKWTCWAKRLWRASTTRSTTTRRRAAGSPGRISSTLPLPTWSTKSLRPSGTLDLCQWRWNFRWKFRWNFVQFCIQVRREHCARQEFGQGPQSSGSHEMRMEAYGSDRGAKSKCIFLFFHIFSWVLF